MRHSVSDNDGIGGVTAARWSLRADDWQIRCLFELGSRSLAIHTGVVALTGFLLAAALPGTAWPYAWTSVMLAPSLILATLARYHAGTSNRHMRNCKEPSAPIRC
jgi:hypothetical protein